MRALKITEADGLFTVETSAGVRSSGASLKSALDKLVAPTHAELNFDWEPLRLVFEGIRDSGGSGIVRSGQAGA